MHCVKFSTNQSITKNGMHPILSKYPLDFPHPECDKSNSISAQYFHWATASSQLQTSTRILEFKDYFYFHEIKCIRENLKW